jgi:hypothetical protein
LYQILSLFTRYSNLCFTFLVGSSEHLNVRLVGRQLGCRSPNLPLLPTSSYITLPRRPRIPLLDITPAALRPDVDVWSTFCIDILGPFR